MFEWTQVMTLPPQELLLIGLGGGLLLLIWFATSKSSSGSLNIKSKVVGDGQHGTARWATPKEISKTYTRVLFKVSEWRKGTDLPKVQGLILGSTGKKDKVTALVDSDDVHCLMIGASGVGKTAFFLYPNLEYACAGGMSFLALDTKGDLARNYGTISTECYGYQVAMIDLRNPTRSDGNNFLALVNLYMDISVKDPKNVAAKDRACLKKRGSYARACLKNAKTPKRRIFFHRTALKNLEIHKVFLRFFALSGENISRCWSFRHLSNKP